MTNPISDFDAAKAVCDSLKDLDKERQQRVLRWVAESLGLVLHVRTERHVDAPIDQHQPSNLPPPLSSPSSGSAVDIKSFVDSKSPRTHNQFATAVAYYYRFEARADEQRDSISPEDLQNATRLAGRARLSNPLNTLNNAKKQGYLDSAERGKFKINSVGENLVAMTLPSGNGASKPAQARKRSAAKRPTATKAGKSARKKKP